MSKPKQKEILNDFLKSLSYGMDYKILEESKDKDEIAKVAKKHHLKLPAKDLSIFKGIYAMIDKENKNGCTLPKEEVEKALDTLNGKSVDFDHFRKKIVGYWLEGAMVDDSIVAYGVFFKGSLQEEYTEITDLFNEGNLKISFEAWGHREYTDASEESYDLKNIEFAGGALLIDTSPAFPQAKVLELAKVMTEPKSFVIEEKAESQDDSKLKKYLEQSKFNVYDISTLMRMLSEVECPGCKEKYSQDIDEIDFREGSIETTCYLCDTKSKVNMTPVAQEMASKGKIEKLVISKKEIVKDKNSSNATEDNNKMEEKLKLLGKAVEDLTAKVTSIEAEKIALKAQLEEANTKIEESKTALEQALEQAKVEKDQAIVTAKEEATKIANRKSELGPEFAKDLKDEEILNDDKFEVAKLKKENAELKKGKKVETKVETASDTTLEAGSKDNSTEASKKTKSIRNLAFGS